MKPQDLIPVTPPDLQAAINNLAAAAVIRRKENPISVPAISASDIASKLDERGFPSRHVKQISLGLYGPALDCAWQYLPRILSGDAMLFLVGDRGPGKTQMATWWAAERIKAGKFPGHYRKTADIISEIKTTWHDGGKSVGTENDVLKKYRESAYLVLDEFHERGSSDWEARTLINILDHRYDNMLVTVLIANMTEEQVRLEINPSILSRAEETGGLVKCNWPSYRTP